MYMYCMCSHGNWLQHEEGFQSKWNWLLIISNVPVTQSTWQHTQHVHVRTCTCMSTCTYMYVCTYMYNVLYVYHSVVATLYEHACTVCKDGSSILKWRPMHVHVYVHTCTYVCTYTCTCTCTMYMYVARLYVHVYVHYVSKKCQQKYHGRKGMYMYMYYRRMGFKCESLKIENCQFFPREPLKHAI